MKKITTLFLASIFIAAGLFAQKTPVVATVDVQRVLNDFTAFQTAVEKVKGSVAPAEEELKILQAKIQEIVGKGREAEAMAANPAASEDAKAEAKATVAGLQGELQAAQQKAQQFQQQAQALAKKGQQDELAPLQEQAMEAVKAVASDKGIDLVLAKNAVMFANDSLEITDAVIAVLNAAE
ncbi:MAG: OmpH family outer membrane protein [Opitutaceae bacterium]